ncbi:hypothetical protein EVJ58_g2258 [Rhodofomes roseus]|nr:hypothetical protein EVJ58_g2258 [Rhodofomes roseus]
MQVAAVKHIRQLFGLDTPFTTILIRDGSVYFVAALILLVINVVYSGVTAINTGILAPIVYSLQTILLSHFYVNLHEAFEARQAGMASEGTQLSELQFGTRLLGTLAGSLAYKDGSALAFADMENDLEWDSERGSKQEGVVELSVIGKSRAGQSSSLSPSSGGSRSFLDDTSTKKTA